MMMRYIDIDTLTLNHCLVFQYYVEIFFSVVSVSEIALFYLLFNFFCIFVFVLLPYLLPFYFHKSHTGEKVHNLTTSSVMP